VLADELRVTGGLDRGGTGQFHRGHEGGVGGN